MNTRALVGVVAVAGMAYILLRRGPSGTSLLDSLSDGDLFGPSAAAPSLPEALPGNAPAQPGSSSSPATTAIGLIGAGSAAVGAFSAIGGSTAAAAGAAATAASGGAATTGAAAAGIGAAGTIALTGGIAGAALLTWAVWKKGLFRGGEEALHVNPDRDQFFAQFGPPSSSGIPYEASGAHKLAVLLTEITHQPNGSPLFAAVQRADTIKDFVAATRAIRDLLATRGIHIQAP